MGRAQKRWAKRERALLILQLGGCCYVCQTTITLEFDCVFPQGDKHHKLDSARRMSFYRRMHKQKNIQLLCSKCHSKKTLIDNQEDLFSNAPF